MVDRTRTTRLLKWLHGGDDAWGTRVDDFDPAAIEAALDKLSTLYGSDDGAYFRTRFEGWDHVPDGPVMVVGNHSGGTTFPDLWGLGKGWYEHFGTGRPLHGLAHDMVFAIEAVGRPFARMGIVRADRALAHEVLCEWKRSVMVLPGGDLETWRPYSERHKVHFNGRKGYARMALKAGVPIVPIAHSGSHQTLIVLTDGRGIARRLHLPQLFRASIFPVHLSLPWGVGIGPWPHLPPPCTLSYRIAKPVTLDEPMEPGTEPTEAQVDELDRRVRAALQAELDVFAAEETGLGERVRSLTRRTVGRLRSLRHRHATLDTHFEVEALAAK